MATWDLLLQWRARVSHNFKWAARGVNLVAELHVAHTLYETHVIKVQYRIAEIEHPLTETMGELLAS